MQDTLVNQEIANLDLSKIAALQQKRTLAFVNHFVITTVQFLNNFAKKCEQKMMEVERKIEKMNATMVLLEARLSSIPEVNTQEDVTNSKPQESKETKEQLKETVEVINEQSETINKETSSETNNSPEAKPEYERFIKMAQVGVPLDAVKLKIALEGLDPAEFDKIMKK